MKGIVVGESTYQIATELGLAPVAVNNKLERVYDQLGVTDRTGLVLKVFQTFRQELEYTPIQITKSLPDLVDKRVG